MVEDEVMETERVSSSLKRLRQTIDGISDDVESTPDAMGNFIANYVSSRYVYAERLFSH